MIDHDEARRCALAYLNTLGLEEGAAILDDATREFDCGWVFSYTSNQYLRTRDWQDAPVGNIPVLVDRVDGRVYLTGPYRTDIYLERFRADKDNLTRVTD